MPLPRPPFMGKVKPCIRWVTNAATCIDQLQNTIDNGNREVIFVAYDCLLNAKEYLEVAFHAFKKGYVYVGMGCTRPVFEMAISFAWCTHYIDDVGDRINRLSQWHKKGPSEEKKAIDQFFRECPSTGSSDHCKFLRKCPLGITPNHCKAMKKRQQDYDRCFGNVKESMPSMRQMLMEVDTKKGGPKSTTSLYLSIWVELCAGSHGRLDPNRNWTLNPIGDWYRKPQEIPPLAPWAVVSTAYAIFAAVFECWKWDQGSIPKEYKELAKKALELVSG